MTTLRDKTFHVIILSLVAVKTPRTWWPERSSNMTEQETMFDTLICMKLPY